VTDPVVLPDGTRIRRDRYLQFLAGHITWATLTRTDPLPDETPPAR
jgi:hypothetical protein